MVLTINRGKGERNKIEEDRAMSKGYSIVLAVVVR